ncbi:MAG: exosortase [Bryobacteraceae bacterium]|nr:exosortase [Bryobacteraceae bacterium]
MSIVVGRPVRDDAPPRTGAPFDWPVVAWFAILLIAAYAQVLYRLLQQWWADPDMGHGFFVPIIAAVIAWGRRDRLRSLALSTNWWGLALVVWASVQLLIGLLGAELFLTRTAFLIALIGAVLFLGGAGLVRSLAFPLFLLFFMVPIPKVIFNQVALPLQLLASNLAEAFLGAIGVPVLREGNILELASQRLNVVEACSGIRSLLSLSFLALVYAYFFDSKPWMRAVLLLASAPIAILANAGRVAITGILSERNAELADGFFHAAEGWVIFVISLAALFLAHRLIDVSINGVSRLVRRPR